MEIYAIQFTFWHLQWNSICIRNFKIEPSDLPDSWSEEQPEQIICGLRSDKEYTEDPTLAQVGFDQN